MFSGGRAACLYVESLRNGVLDCTLQDAGWRYLFPGLPTAHSAARRPSATSATSDAGVRPFDLKIKRLSPAAGERHRDAQRYDPIKCDCMLEGMGRFVLIRHSARKKSPLFFLVTIARAVELLCRRLEGRQAMMTAVERDSPSYCWRAASVCHISALAARHD